jgi:hypothetical protein
MSALGNAATILNAYDQGNPWISEMESDEQNLRDVLADTIADSHPETPDDVKFEQRYGRASKHGNRCTHHRRERENRRPLIGGERSVRTDSPLEGGVFELAVPRRIYNRA